MNVLKYGLLLGVVACDTSTGTRLERIETKLTRIDSIAHSAEMGVWYTAPQVSYQLSDVGRDRKNVGWLHTALPIARGDRIFLGDDMWDVTFVKVFGTQADTNKASQILNVELLVTYAGKARDQKPGS